MNMPEILQTYRDYRNMRANMDLPDFTANNPKYVPGQEIEYIKKQMEKLKKPTSF